MTTRKMEERELTGRKPLRPGSRVALWQEAARVLRLRSQPGDYRGPAAAGPAHHVELSAAVHWNRWTLDGQVLVWNGKQSVERVGDSGLSSESPSEETTEAASSWWPVESKEQTTAE